jgi:hypothetical protein
MSGRAMIDLTRQKLGFFRVLYPAGRTRRGEIRSLKLRKRVAEHQAKHEDPSMKTRA